MVCFIFKKNLYQLSQAELTGHVNTLLYKLWDENRDNDIILQNPYIDLSDNIFVKLIDCVINYYKRGEILVPTNMNSLTVFYKLQYFLIDVPIENYILKNCHNILSHYRSICIQKQKEIFVVCYNVLLDKIKKCCENGYTECIIILITDDDDITQFRSNKSIIHHIRHHYLFFQCENNRRKFVNFLKTKQIDISFFKYNCSLVESNTAFIMKWFYK